SVVGRVRPLIVKPVPVRFACEIVTVVPPVFVSCSERLEFVPTWTLPKARLAGFAESVPGVTPVPVTGIFRFGLAPSDVMATLPLTAPPDVGANCTWNDVD